MTTHAHNSGAPESLPELHLTRAEKFALLRAAVSTVHVPRKGRRADLKAFIESVEVTTLSDGRCHLTQDALSERLHWSDDKLRAVRKLAVQLGWVESVDLPCSECGRPVVKLRVNWPTIANAARRAKPQEPAGVPPQLAGQAPQLTDVPPRTAESAYKEFIPHEVQKRNESHEAFAFGKRWPKDIGKKTLRSPRMVQRLFELACALWPDITEHDQRGFFACAVQAHTKGKKPGGLFTSLVKVRAWRKPPSEPGGIPDTADDAARRMISELARPKRPSYFAVERERQRQLTAGEELKLRYEKKHAGAAGPGVFYVPQARERHDVDADSFGATSRPVNPTHSPEP